MQLYYIDSCRLELYTVTGRTLGPQYIEGMKETVKMLTAEVLVAEKMGTVEVPVVEKMGMAEVVVVVVEVVVGGDVNIGVEVEEVVGTMVAVGIMVVVVAEEVVEEEITESLFMYVRRFVLKIINAFICKVQDQ